MQRLPNATNDTAPCSRSPRRSRSTGIWLHYFTSFRIACTRSCGSIALRWCLSRAYLPGMKQRDWGRIVFISSESGIQIPVEMIHYGTTKTAQLAVSRGLAETCAGTGVTVNAVLPGPTRSAGVDEFVTQLSGGQPFEQFEKEFFTSVRPTSLLKRFETPQEIASLVTFVCSPVASGINGAALRVDGGVVRSCF